VLELVQDRVADGEPRLVAVVPLGDLRVQIPAVVIEAPVGDLLTSPSVRCSIPETDDVGDWTPVSST
jgi:hypothetical protein